MGFRRICLYFASLPIVLSSTLAEISSAEKRAGCSGAAGFVDIERAHFLLADDGHGLMTARKLA
jgi:hypothetical protein